MMRTSSLGKCVPSNRQTHDVTVHCLLPQSASTGTPSPSVIILRTHIGEISCSHTSGVAALVDRREGSTLKMLHRFPMRAQIRGRGARKDLVTSTNTHLGT
jgi:hypothetical protein